MIRFDHISTETLQKLNKTSKFTVFCTSLVKKLQDEDDFVRKAAAYALGEIKPTDPEILENLVALLKDENLFVRIVAAKALGHIKPTNPKIHKKLVKLMKDEDADALTP